MIPLTGEEAVLAALLQEIISQMKPDGLVDRLRAEIEQLRGKYAWGSLVGPILQGAFGLFTGGVPVALPGGPGEPAAKPREVKLPDARGFVRQGELRKRLPYLYDFQRAIDYLLRAWVTGGSAADDETRIDDRDGVLVVFVDDLDRCPSDRVVQVLETLKLFLDKRGCVFVLGMDCRLVEQAVRAKYRDAEGLDAHAFMGKILQLRFNLPPIRGEEIEAYVRDELGPGEALGKYLHFVSGGGDAVPGGPEPVRLLRHGRQRVGMDEQPLQALSVSRGRRPRGFKWNGLQVPAWRRVERPRRLRAFGVPGRQPPGSRERLRRISVCGGAARGFSGVVVRCPLC